MTDPTQTNVLYYGDNLDTDSRHPLHATWARGFALVTIAILASSCTSYHPTPPPTVAETEAFVARMVSLAQAGQFEQLCEMGGGNCEHILESAGAQNVPLDPPAVARIYVVPSIEHADGSWSQGGQMVEMCGNDRNGAPYQTQMIVFRDPHEGVIGIEPIFWSGLSISVGVVTDVPVNEPSDPPFEC